MVILDEILMHADDPMDQAAEQWNRAMFPGHGLGRDTLGTAETVKAITTADIARFFEAQYRPGNMVVSAAGDCDHDRLAEAVEARFTGRLGGGPPTRLAPSAPPVPVVVVEQTTEQAHLVLGTRSVSRFDETRWALAILNHTLGGGLSSRLFRKVREERGLAYSIWSERATFEETGSLCVVAGTAPDNVDEVLAIVSDEFDLLAERGITERELAVAKGSLRAESLLSHEDSGARMNRLGSALLLHGHVRTVDEILARIDAVTLEEVHAVARTLAAAPRTLAAVGPLDPAALDPAALGSAGRPG